MLYLLGIENKKSVMFGQNLLTAKSGVVYEETHMARGSFISDDIIFYYPDNGILVNAVAIDRRTGEPVPSAGYEDIIASARKVYSDCDALLRNNKVVINKTE
jgi:phosphoglycerol transferase MdoB-like AlkP superfamily enzyme